MQPLTVNQIMLLLDIYRGTDTQDEIGTAKADWELLCNRGLVVPKGLDELTPAGDALVQQIKAMTINWPQSQQQK